MNPSIDGSQSQQVSFIAFQPQSSIHLTHIISSSEDPYEKFAIQFQLSRAIIWQIKFILSSVQSKKSVTSASQEFANLSESYGKDFDKYLLKELLEQIDIKDSSKASKDKTESVKITLLNQEINRASLKPEFLTYFSDIFVQIYGDQQKQKAAEFLQEMIKRLKLSAQTQILLCLSMLESTNDDQISDEIIKIFRQKLIDYHVNGKPDQLPEYAVHRILFLFDTVNILQQDPLLKEPKQLIIETISNRQSQFTPLRSSMHQDVSQANCHPELPAIHLLRDGNGLENLEFANKVLQPWEILIDIGHNSSYMYDFLLKTLSEFKGIDEKVMAQTVLHLSMNYQGKDDHISKIVYNTFESNINGNAASIKKEPEDKKTIMTWSIDNLARAFRELYSNLNWLKVFEQFGELEDDDIPQLIHEQGIDQKQFSTLCQIFNKSKPQNIQFPLQSLLTNQWKSPILQLAFIKGCINSYVQKKDKNIIFNKLKNRASNITELQDIKERGESQESIEVWQCVDLVERIIILSENQGLFVPCRKVFENPIKQIPEYLLISLSLAKPYVGNVLLDELLSILLPLFLGDHLNSTIVLQQLFKCNSSLFIRGICELCKHDQRLMNLSRVLDITQEVKQSLIPIVYSEDYDFAVNLGILAGKRDFLHYDVWIKSRLRDVGTPFISALLKYINDHIITPVSDFTQRNIQQAESNHETFEMQKNQILDKSHLSKEKLLLTLEHMRNCTLGQNDKVDRDSINQINDLNNKIRELFPQQQEAGQNSEEIDAAANEHFQRVFSAEDNEVDKRIEELIQTMQNFKESQDIREQEIYACMLHGLFDEYRFLHRYPQQYLTKIAKLFGAIIKNNLLDRVLQDIALKFVIEAFRRDGRRQKFGIIVIKSFFDRLHRFPNFLKDIYQIRQSIQNTEPQMMLDIERMYLESQQQITPRIGVEFQPNQAQVYGNIDQSQPAPSEIQNELNAQQVQIQNEIDVNNVNQQQQQQAQIQQKNINSGVTNQNSQSVILPQQNSQVQNQKDAQKKNATQNQRQQIVGQSSIQSQQNQAAPSGAQNNRQSNKTQKGIINQSGMNPQQFNQDQIYKSMTPPINLNINNNTREFIPAARGPVQIQPNAIMPLTITQSLPLVQQKPFIPNPKINASFSTKIQQPSAIIDHMNTANPQNTQIYNKMNKTQTGLNLDSEAFIRPLSIPNMGNGNPFDIPKQKEININSKEFLPSRLIYNDQMYSFNFKNSLNPQQIQELLEFQKKINEKIKKAIDSGMKIRLDDLLEDETIKVDDENIEDQLRIICNNTGKGNFKQKIEELKKYVIKKPQKLGENGKEIIDEKSSKADDILRWLIHYIISKRLNAQSMSLQSTFIEILRELNQFVPRNQKQMSVIALTLVQTQLILKKCLAIDEDEFMKATNVAQGSSSVIKGYLQSLGTFIGSLTLAKNESIRNTHLDLKQILIEGSQIKNSRLPIAFVCRVLKELKQSKLFTHKNPWILSLLQILKEIYENAQFTITHVGNSQFTQDNIMEIDSLFTSLNIQNSLDIKPHGILQGFLNQNHMLDQIQRRELDYICKKNKIILPIHLIQQNIQEESKQQHVSFQSLSSQVQRINNQQNKLFLQDQEYDQIGIREAQEKREQQMFQISQAVKVSEELVQLFQRYYNSSEQVIRKLVGKAVDDSIVEILPPVVDRSVTIALITTRELVLKDFAHDGDYQRVLNAADLIVQNLAGSLALVTCREPLRMSLTTNLKKIFESHFKNDLGLIILPSAQRHSDSTLSSDNQLDSNNLNNVGDQNEYQTQISEEKINEISILASRENLELGCKLIKKEVIDKALKKVREDSQINQAVEKRKRSEELGIKQFRDENIVLQFQELPPQLQPNQNGLTPAQFQVYADFERLGQSQRDGDLLNSRIWQNQSSIPQNQIQNQIPQNLTQILKFIDQQGLTDANKEYLVAKINQMNQGLPSEEEKEKLWTYVQRNLETACKNYPQNIDSIIDVLSLIVKTYKVEDFSKRLLTGVFLLLDVRIFNDVDLNILLMSKEIISISEWDTQLALFFKESAAQLPESELQFFSKFLEASIIDKKILTINDVPQLIQILEKMSSDKKIGRFCQYILQTLNSNNGRQQQIESDQNQQMLKEYFIRWVVLSYIEENQKQLMNTFFSELEGIKLIDDQRLLFSFCKQMVHTSIEMALVYSDTGEKRPADRLDFRYIDSFVKLIVVLLKHFITNKHEFMQKILDFIAEDLDYEHKNKQASFNQRPYYRMIMNILTAINLSECFNPKTQLLILFSMADLFKNLNPIQYPAFCFAWLELVSHKWFLPHFLKGSSNAIVGSSSPALSQQMAPLSGQQQFSTFQNFQGHQMSGQDNTFYQKRIKMKEIIEYILIFLKSNLIPGQQTPPVLQAFYHATLRVINVIKQDFPDFLSDYHYDFVNCLPEHSLQLRNLILSATPQNIQQPDPFSRDLKIDLLHEIKQTPRILSDYQIHLKYLNLKEDLENYTKNRSQHLITEICRKIELSEEVVNGRRKINQNVVSAVVLFIANWNANKKNPQESQREEHREARDTFKQIVKTLGDEARLSFLNAIVNELRYPNNHTFYFSCIILFIYAEADREIIYEQISAIFLERLQTQGPYPWGLMISFRELIQIPKFQFMKRNYIRSHPQAINRLFTGQLRNFLDFIPTSLMNQFMIGNTNQGAETHA